MASIRKHGSAWQVRWREFRRAWARAGVPVEVWHGRPIHGFRHVLETEFRAAGGDWLGIETLVGHVAPGTGGAFYLAARANWPGMLAAVRLIPPLTVPAGPRKSIPFPGSRR